MPEPPNNHLVHPLLIQRRWHGSSRHSTMLRRWLTRWMMRTRRTMMALLVAETAAVKRGAVGNEMKTKWVVMVWAFRTSTSETIRTLI